jgi:(E)-4-hydroxy-3-methylbut-2-enyl-diphosphate synthase
MSRYGDTPMGMVESAMEFLRIARAEQYHNIILSMKSSNPQVMVQAYRLLVKTMQEEFSVCYPLHLGVTEAGDGEDGRIKSAIGIGTLLEDGIGDTIRVSLTEDPEFEIPVCRDIVNRYKDRAEKQQEIPFIDKPPYDPFMYRRRTTGSVSNIGSKQVPVVVSDMMHKPAINAGDLEVIGYRYSAELDKWNIGDAAADYLYTGNKILDFNLPGTLKVLVDHATWLSAPDQTKYHPVLRLEEYTASVERSSILNFICFDVSRTNEWERILNLLAADATLIA